MIIRTSIEQIERILIFPGADTRSKIDVEFSDRIKAWNSSVCVSLITVAL